MVSLQLLLSVFLTVSILYSSPDSRSLDVCLGNYERHFTKNSGYKVCFNGNLLIRSFCNLSVLLHILLSSNLIEAFFLYSCFKEIRTQDENVKDLLGEKQYLRRKRDNGIVISISIIQWATEVANFVFYYIYMYFLHGLSNYSDKFFALYLITFTMVIQPSFYLGGDFNFRRNLVQHGIFFAVKSVLFQ